MPPSLVQGVERFNFFLCTYTRCEENKFINLCICTYKLLAKSHSLCKQKFLASRVHTKMHIKRGQIFELLFFFFNNNNRLRQIFIVLMCKHVSCSRKSLNLWADNDRLENKSTTQECALIFAQTHTHTAKCQLSC